MTGAKVTRQGRESLNQQLQEKVAKEIEFEFKGNLTEDQRNLVEDIGTWNDGRIIQVGSKNEILRFLEFGTAPHKITAKNSEYLAFEWPDAPQEVQEMFASTFPLVFFKEVNHPGIEAYGHLRKAVGDVQ